jgi:hypothetical protein
MNLTNEETYYFLRSPTHIYALPPKESQTLLSHSFVGLQCEIKGKKNCSPFQVTTQVNRHLFNVFQALSWVLILNESVNE